MTDHPRANPSCAEEAHTSAEPSAVVRLTSLQRTTLERLADLDRRNTLVGFNPCSFGGERASASARGMAAKGWVALSRVSERHVRYSITIAGLMALEAAGEAKAATPAQLGPGTPS